MILIRFVWKSVRQKIMIYELSHHQNALQGLCSIFFAYHYRYYETMRRRNYVTPTSYLELIKTFKSLLDHKRMEILTLKNRYIVGLEKLEFSESQVGGPLSYKIMFVLKGIH